MSSIFASAPNMPQAPTPVVTPPPVMPVPDDEKAAAKRKLALAGAAAARGRQSTVLTQDSGSTDLLGG